MTLQLLLAPRPDRYFQMAQRYPTLEQGEKKHDLVVCTMKGTYINDRPGLYSWLRLAAYIEHHLALGEFVPPTDLSDEAGALIPRRQRGGAVQAALAGGRREGRVALRALRPRLRRPLARRRGRHGS